MPGHREVLAGWGKRPSEPQGPGAPKEKSAEAIVPAGTKQEPGRAERTSLRATLRAR